MLFRSVCTFCVFYRMHSLYLLLFFRAVRKRIEVQFCLLFFISNGKFTDFLSVSKNNRYTSTCNPCVFMMKHRRKSIFRKKSVCKTEKTMREHAKDTDRFSKTQNNRYQKAITPLSKPQKYRLNHVFCFLSVSA